MSNRRYTDMEIIDVNPLNVEGVPLVIDDMTLAFRLGFTNKVLWYAILHPNQVYKQFSIKKASGKLRTIHAPTSMMKLLLTMVRVRFLLPLVRNLGPHVTAYRENQGARDAVRKHLHSCSVCDQYDVPHTCATSINYDDKTYKVLKANPDCKACAQPPKHDNCSRRGVKVHLDLRDFFPSTRASWIREYLHQTVGYNARVSSLLASLMTVPLERKIKGVTRTVRGVPQGGPTSGDICNLVADRRLDQPLLRALEGTGWHYTRYADDLYFSHSENLPAEKITELIETVRAHARAAGWLLNNEKIHVQRAKWQQRLLGVTLNRKPNIPNDKYRKIRVIVHRCFVHGFAAEAQRLGFPSDTKLTSWVGGQISWFTAINPVKAEKLRLIFEAAREKHNGSRNKASNDML